VHLNIQKVCQAYTPDLLQKLKRRGVGTGEWSIEGQEEMGEEKAIGVQGTRGKKEEIRTEGMVGEGTNITSLTSANVVKSVKQAVVPMALASLYS
jgi:hypothetical protein